MSGADGPLARERLEAALAEHRPAFGAFFLARFLDLRITYGDRTCRVELPPLGDLLHNPQGSLHGGVIALVLDVSMGHLHHRFLGTAVTLEMKTQYLRPVVGPCWCEARFTKTGRRVVFAESRLHDDQGRACAVATGTWLRVERTEAPDARDDP